MYIPVINSIPVVKNAKMPSKTAIKMVVAKVEIALWNDETEISPIITSVAALP